MLFSAGQTAGPNWLTFLKETQSIFFKMKFLNSMGQHRELQLVFYKALANVPGVAHGI